MSLLFERADNGRCGETAMNSPQPSTANDWAGIDVSESITAVVMVHPYTTSFDSSVTAPTLVVQSKMGTTMAMRGYCGANPIRGNRKHRSSGDERSKENVLAPGGTLFGREHSRATPGETDVMLCKPASKVHSLQALRLWKSCAQDDSRGKL
jgi:hypothetical protein